MIRRLFSITCVMLLLLWPTQAQETTKSTLMVVPLVPARLNTVSESNYLNQLAIRGYRLETQGLLIESMDGSKVFAELNSNTAFNPASVIKLATSFAALSKFGPEHQFETAVYADGSLDKKTRTLKGDLVLMSEGDPTLNTTDVNRLIRQVIKSGISRVTGDLVISGPLAFGASFTTDSAIKALKFSIRKLGLRIGGETKKKEIEKPDGEHVASLVSKSLRSILFFQNAHSSNPIAERVGNAVGGPAAVEHFLEEQVGIPAPDVYITRTSGLDFNRITAQGTVQLLRQMAKWLETNGMLPQDIMPVAGIDPGTLHARFTSEPYRGGIVAKTGTLPGTDGGVSTLAGILYSRDSGPLIFAIFNTKANVNTSRRLQDGLLKAFVAELGGIAVVSASSRKLSN